MKKSSIGQKAILLGNGINYLSADSIGWGDILENLKNSPEINQINTEIQKVDLKNPLKPFPLAYEEILNLLSQDTTIDIDRLLKQSIVSNISNQLIKKKGFNKYHTDILNTKIKHILTTNYDYGLELSKIENFQNEKKEYSINNFEIKKNNHRGYILPSDQYIWHIHGELSDNRSHTKSPNEYAEQSILIGNEYYGISIKNIEQYISGKEKSKHAKSLVKRISNNDPVSSWIDLFFTHDIYFIGLGLDFVEQDIWWLLNYRANVKKRFLAKGIEINTVVCVEAISIISPLYTPAYPPSIVSFTNVDGKLYCGCLTVTRYFPTGAYNLSKPCASVTDVSTTFPLETSISRTTTLANGFFVTAS